MLPNPDSIGRGAPTQARARRISVSGTATHIGQREDNQDCVHANDEVRLYIVADGLGGRPGGGEASQLAVDEVCRVVNRSKSAEDTVQLRIDLRGTPEENLIEHALRCAHRAVMRGRVGELTEMATTIAVVHLAGGAAVIGHVGDSRVYLLRERQLSQLTKDHSLVNDLLDLGNELTSAERQSQSHVVMRALGVPRGAEPALRRVEVQSGDVFLLCSDGLYGVLEDAQLAELLAGTDPETAVERLVAAAFAANGQDNISAVAVRVP